MRTTLTINDSEYAFAQSLAQARAIKLGDAIAEILRTGRETIQSASGLKMRRLKGGGGLMVIDTPPAARKVSVQEVADMIARSEQEEDDRSIAFATTGKFPDWPS